VEGEALHFAEKNLVALLSPNLMPGRMPSCASIKN